MAQISELLASKKFKVLAILVALWTNPVHEALGLDITALPWITASFCAFMISQGISDLGDRAVDAVRLFRGIASPKEDETKE